jgi:lysophospholipase L1-like esterase
LDNGLRDLANTTDGVTHVPLDFQMDAAFMAADGFHPGPKVYDAWAARVVELLMDMVGQLDRDQ